MRTSPELRVKDYKPITVLNFVFFVPSYLNVWRFIVFTCHFKPVCCLINYQIFSAGRCNDYVFFYNNDGIIKLLFIPALCFKFITANYFLRNINCPQLQVWWPVETTKETHLSVTAKLKITLWISKTTNKGNNTYISVSKPIHCKKRIRHKHVIWTYETDDCKYSIFTKVD